MKPRTQELGRTFGSSQQPSAGAHSIVEKLNSTLFLYLPRGAAHIAAEDSAVELRLIRSAIQAERGRSPVLLAASNRSLHEALCVFQAANPPDGIHHVPPLAFQLLVVFDAL